MIVQEMMSSDESGVDEDGKAVIFVTNLPWRSGKVGRFFERLDISKINLNKLCVKARIGL